VTLLEDLEAAATALEANEAQPGPAEYALSTRLRDHAARLREEWQRLAAAEQSSWPSHLADAASVALNTLQTINGGAVPAAPHPGTP